jgi:hypothetical protein
MVPQMKRLVSRAPPNWGAQFASSVHSYRSSQLQANSNRLNNTILDLEAYLNLRRDLSGFNMVFDLIELTEIAAFSVPNTPLREKMESLKRLAADIITCSLVRAFRSGLTSHSPDSDVNNFLTLPVILTGCGIF